MMEEDGGADFNKDFSHPYSDVRVVASENGGEFRRRTAVSPLGLGCDESKTNDDGAAMMIVCQCILG